MTSMNTILGTAGLDRADLTATVDEHRSMSMNQEIVPASHFPVEDLASGIEQLGTRLHRILALTQDFLGRDDEAGALARHINSTALTDVTGVKESLRKYLDLPAVNPDGSAPLLSDVPLYGYPDLRCVTHGILDHTRRTFVRNHYLVSVSSGEATRVPDTMNVFETAALISEKEPAHV
ncbi:hypothetical protein [Paenarthrobacter sp. YJN-5]|uniref:hypothetical protein n=1 Tax=Paenarthrobacter sp. YJN-5 TaxID=2735316 RepID=UPI0018789034|nr:hypothetical protein [Paenarthrobacter sp. YJN-5]QOT19599.1 hypothetical protein HMI59_23550 [Paenarthrobacter sp. YJN-5]